MGLSSKLILLVLFSTEVALSVEYKRIRCDEPFLKQSWPDLVQNEHAIGEAFNKIVAHAGTTKVVNCVIEFPTENDQPVFGSRRAILDLQWYETIIQDGVPQKLFRQEGMKIEYLLAPPAPGLPAVRQVHGLLVCRTPEMCRQLQIPFRLEP